MFSLTSFSMWGCLLLIIGAKTVATQDFNLTIPLDKATTYQDKQMYEDYLTLNRTSTLKVNFNKLNKNVLFIIFQAHSHLYNITMYKNIELENSTVSGTNIGLHSENMKTDIFFIHNPNKDVDLKLYVVVHGYSGNDPLPGGCNMESRVQTAPYMTAIYNREFIKVDAAPAGILSSNPYLAKCNFLRNRIVYEFYMLYLPEQNFDSDVYFDALTKMTSLKNILQYGRRLPATAWFTRRMVSSYPGTGAVYVVVSYLKAAPVSYSLYVPTSSYGCSPVNEDCELMEDSLSQLMCGSLFFIGLFICYFGHRFFKTQTFFIGFLSGLVVTYILISLILNLDRPAILAASALSGVCIGASRVVYWWIYGLPVFSIILSSADVGFLVAALLLYIAPDDWTNPLYLHLNVNFWMLFILIITIITIVLLSVNVTANFICCAVVGAYATILPIDYYLGSNMKYILINIMRRAAVTDYNKALKVPPFQYKDWILAFSWLGLAITGFIYQFYRNKGRPPFPPPPRSVRAVPEEPVNVAGPSGYSTVDSGGVHSIPYRFSDRLNEKTPLLS